MGTKARACSKYTRMAKSMKCPREDIEGPSVGFVSLQLWAEGRDSRF